MKKQTLVQAVHLAMSGKSKAMASALCMSGCPIGGWADTEQARRETANELPVRSLRSYTVSQFISACYAVDASDRYQMRTQSDTLAEAARIEASVA